MRALIQRVSSGKVTVDDQTIAQIGSGLVVLLGIGQEDGEEQAVYLAEKIANLRIFEDEAGKTNLSVLNVGGEAIVVSQFTLLCRYPQRTATFVRLCRSSRDGRTAGGTFCRTVARTRRPDPDRPVWRSHAGGNQ